MFKEVKQCTKNFMGFRNKGKKLNSELLILKVSVLLSFPGHIRRRNEGDKEVGKFYFEKFLTAEGDISVLIFLIY